MEATTIDSYTTFYTTSFSSTTQGTNLPAYYQFQKFTTVVINPIIAIVGLFGNVLSILVLAKSGLKKPSNILLVSLCVADSMSLIAAFNIPQIITFFPNKSSEVYRVWEYPEDVCYILYVLSMIFLFCYNIGLLISASLVVLITIERLLAVYLPLQFKSIVTRNRTLMAVVLVYLFWIPFPIYVALLFRLNYVYVVVWDVSVGHLLFNPDETIVLIEQFFVRTVGVYAPAIFVFLGSLLIAIRVKLNVKKRKKIVSQTSKASTKTSKTTTTLLTVCVVFIVTKLITLLTNFLDFTIDPKDPNYTEKVNLRIFISISSSILFNINACSNFVIYVVLNQKFRQNFQQIIKYKRK